MNREEMLSRILDRTGPWDMLVIGGGATGIGIAVDAASRGYDVLLVEESDFGKGTSSWSMIWPLSCQTMTGGRHHFTVLDSRFTICWPDVTGSVRRKYYLPMKP